MASRSRSLLLALLVSVPVSISSIAAADDPPTAPRNLSAHGLENAMFLAWDAPVEGDPDSYRLYASNDSVSYGLLATLPGSNSTYEDAPLPANFTRWYRVSAVTAGVEGGFSNVATNTTYPARPGAPRNLTAYGYYHGVTLVWNASDEGGPALGYILYRNGAWLGSTEADQTWFDDPDAPRGVVSAYEVFAYGYAGAGPSAFVNGTAYTNPSAPRNLTATPGRFHMDLAWQAPASDGGAPIVDYAVWRRNASSVALVGYTPNLSYADGPLPGNATFEYWVVAWNGYADSPGSNHVNATTIGHTLPSAPRDLAAVVAPGVGNVNLSWLAPLDDGGLGIDAYYVYRGNTSGEMGLIATVGASWLTFSDEGAIPGRVNHYVVRAENALGLGPASNVATAEPHGPPSEPRDLAAVGGRNQVSLSWTAPEVEGGTLGAYHVYRAPDLSSSPTFLAAVNGTSYLDAGLANNTTYVYYVSATNEHGEGFFATVNGTTLAVEPSAPRNLTAISAVTSTTLTWSAPDSNGGDAIRKYRVYRGTTSGNHTFLAETTSLSYVDGSCGLTCTRYYVVRAVNVAGEGPASNEARSGL